MDGKMKQGDKIKNYCNNCHIDTFHTVCAVKKTDGSDGEISWWTNYGILECDGCKTVVFKTEEACSEDYDEDGDHIREKFFPPLNKDLGNAEEIIYKIPDEIQPIYKETLSAISNECYILAGIGLRAIVESICDVEEIPKKDHLEEKIDKLVGKGFLSKNDGDNLHAIRFMGNDAAHDRKKFDRDQIITAYKIIKNFLLKYAIKKEIDENLELPIRNFNDFVKMVNEKIEGKPINESFTLSELIGKDKRRCDKQYNSFIDQYEKKISEGKFDNIELLTSPSMNNSSSEKQYQKKQ